MAVRVQIRRMSQPPRPPVSQRGCRPGGCILGCFGVVVGVPLLLALIGYVVIFHTSLPLKYVANSLNTSQSEITLRGVSGSISRGFKVQEVVIDGDSEKPDSTIKGLTFRYLGFWDAMFDHRFVIEEISADSSEFVVSPEFFDLSTANDDAEEPITSSSTSSGGVQIEEMGLFELRNLDLRDTRIRTADGEFDVRIPTIRLSGLRIEGDDFELAELEVESDVLTMELEDATPERIDNQFVPFSRKIRGAVNPGLHGAIRRPFDFSIEFASVGSLTKTRIRAFDGAFEHVDLPDGGTRLTFSEFSVADYFDLGSKPAVERLSIVFRSSAEESTELKAESGEFHLGATRFEVPAQAIDRSNALAWLEAHGHVAGAKIDAVLRNHEKAWVPAIELRSDPEMTIHEILARVYFEASYEELAADQKEKVDTFAGALAGLN